MAQIEARKAEVFRMFLEVPSIVSKKLAEKAKQRLATVQAVSEDTGEYDSYIGPDVLVGAGGMSQCKGT